MTSLNHTASNFNSLKTRLVAEFNRRNKNGSLSGTSSTMTPTPTLGGPILASQGQALIDDALKIGDISGFAKVQQGDLLPDINTLDTKLGQ